MKRIIAVFVVLSFLVVSASAAGVYEVEPDTVPIEDSVFPSVSTYSTYDLTATESTYLMEIRDYSELIYNIVNWGFDTNLDSIWARLGYLMSDTSGILTAVGTSNYWLQQLYSSSASESTLSSVLSSVDLSNYWLEEIWSSVASEATLSSVEDILSVISGKVATESTLTALRSSFVLPAGHYFLYASGNMKAVDFALQPVDLLNNGFSGLSANLKDLLRESSSDGSGMNYMTSTGTVASDSPLDLARLVRVGFLGVRSLISGSEADNTYSGTITNNDNSETSFSAIGLGPLLNKYLDAIQLDTGRLTYMFASPEDLEAKKKSESTTESFTDNFLNPDSDASIKLSDVGILKDSSKTVQELGQTGVTPGQAFDQLTGNGSIFSFFTQETANDLDTTVSTYSRDPGTQIVTSYYADSRAEFFDLIGKGGDE